MRRLIHQSGFRRLVFAALALVVIDPFVSPMLSRLERARYESNRLFRFENSDLFALGPLVSYLRDHPKGEKPRVAFIGDSVIWGYFISPTDTVSAQFQRLRPHVRVFNLGINGFETPSAYLIAKAIIEAVDTIYVLPIGGAADRTLSRLVPVSPQDVETFRLEPPDTVELRLEHALDFWHLYRDSYRLQSAFFGTSTRLYLYLHKGELLRRIRGESIEGEGVPSVIPDPDQSLRHVIVDLPRTVPAPDSRQAEVLAGRYPLYWQFAALARFYRKQIVFMEMANHSPSLAQKDRADLNAIFSPYATFLRFQVPDSLQFDHLHLNPVGSQAVAQMLVRDAPPQLAGDAR